jgi:hypothetical protein
VGGIQVKTGAAVTAGAVNPGRRWARRPPARQRGMMESKRRFSCYKKKAFASSTGWLLQCFMVPVAGLTFPSWSSAARAAVANGMTPRQCLSEHAMRGRTACGCATATTSSAGGRARAE